MERQAGSLRTDAWFEVWAARSLDPSRGSLHAQLLAADGFDTAFGDVDEGAWTAYVRRWAAKLGITTESSVFEVGCGAGAFLHQLRELGSEVAGLDQSEALIEIARSVMPEASFEVADAAELSPEPRVDFVLSSGVFGYFPSLDYARQVIELIAAKARRAVLILDLPDQTTREAAHAARVDALGGSETYARRYEGLDHLYYERSWVAEALRECNLIDVATADQDLAGYGNGRFRFNAWAFRPGE